MKKVSMKLVCDLTPIGDNGRNSEGDFLRAPNGDILFAYSRYNTSGGGVLYTVYNPTPNYNGRKYSGISWGRTPLVIRKSTNWGKTWGDLHIIEDDPNRGYCYPAMFVTNDGHMLCAYCRGGEEDRCCLNRLGIAKIDLGSIE